MMNSKYLTVTIGEVAKVKGGKRLPKGKLVQDEPTNHPYIRVVDFRTDGLDRSNIKYIDDESYKATWRYTITLQDVYISIAGTIGLVGVIPKELLGANLTENAAKICEIDSSVDIRCVMYYLRSPEGQAQIVSKIVGTSQPKLALFRIKEISIPRPPLPIQQKIAAVLSIYDDLIENNLRRIKILEQIAKIIYHEWFVKFRFPGYEDVKMSESDLGPIPEGWMVRQLGELVEIQKGRKAKGLSESPNDRSVPYLLIDGLKNEKHVFTEDGGLPIAYDDDVLMVMDGASSGTVFIGASGVVGSTLACFRPTSRQSLSPYTLYLFLQYNQEEIRSNNVGSAIPHANKAFIASMNIVSPQAELNYEMHRQFRQIFVEIRTLKLKNINLRRTRDLLLPKLISGELDVDELDIDTEEVGR